MPEQRIDRVRRLDFSLPAFHRISWVSDTARTVWKSRLQALVRARPRIFVHAARAGIYPCAHLRLTETEIGELQIWLKDWDDCGLAHLAGADSAGDRDRNRQHWVVGRADMVEAFAAAWSKDQRATLDDLTKLPDCCRAFRNKLRDELKLNDPVLAQALNTAGAVIEGRDVQLASPKLLNTLPDLLGLLPLAHMPCSMSCHASRSLAAAWVETARANGFGEEMDNLEVLLSWPMEWSALHGIAEIKMPILKIAANTDATAETYRVRLLSDRYPEEGVSGLHFPFQPPHYAKISDSKRFKDGLANPIRELKVWKPEPPQPVIMEIARQASRRDDAGLQLRPRSSHILDETLIRLRAHVSMQALQIESIFLSNYFNVIRLNDGSTGACMNYFRFKSEEATEKTRAWLLEQVERDRLLMGYLNEDGEPDLLQLSLKACLVSALSQNLLKRDDLFRVSHRFAPCFFPHADSAVVIGFGGYMDYLIHMTDTKQIHVSDLYIHHRTRTIRNRLEFYKEKFPEKVITFSDGSDNRERLAGADLVSITASAFCSGTMDELLEEAGDCKTVIVQGQSGAIFPEVLFEKRVSLVSTSMKPANLVELARSDPPQFKKLLEGGLPVIYLEPLA
jgi:hypothetical protein